MPGLISEAQMILRLAHSGRSRGHFVRLLSEAQWLALRACAADGGDGEVGEAEKSEDSGNETSVKSDGL